MNAAPRIRDERGQTMAEFAIVLPVLVVLLFGVIQFGILFNNYVTLTDAVRAGARTAAVSRNDADPTGAATTAVRNVGLRPQPVEPQRDGELGLDGRHRRDRDGDVPVLDQPARLGRHRRQLDLQDDGASRMSSRTSSHKISDAITTTRIGGHTAFD